MKDCCIGMNIKQKNKNENVKNEYRYFIELNFVGVGRLLVLIYENQNDSVKKI